MGRGAPSTALLSVSTGFQVALLLCLVAGSAPVASGSAQLGILSSCLVTGMSAAVAAGWAGGTFPATPPTGIRRVSDAALPLCFVTGSAHDCNGSAQLCGWFS